MRSRVGAAGAERLCALGAFGRLCAAAQRLGVTLAVARSISSPPQGTPVTS